MCIAIYKPSKLHLLEETINNCWSSNPDGAGFMYAENGVLIIVKGLMTLTAFKEALEPHKNKELVIHFRIATHGGVSEDNTHPFMVDNNLAVIHNGIIHKVECKTDTTKTDTWHFIDQYLKKFRKTLKNFWLKEEYKVVIEEYLGNSKLVFMDNKGNVDIYNESLGNWDSEVWFSNTSYKRTAYTYTHKGNYKPQKAQRWKNGKWEDVPDTPTEVIPYKREGALNSFTVGDFVRLDYNTVANYSYQRPDDVSDIIAGTKVKITSCFNHASIWIVDPATSLEATVPFWKLSVWKEPETTFTENDFIASGEEIVFVKNHNHFRVGDTKKVIMTSLKHLTVQDDKKEGRCYLIPKEYVRPFNALFETLERKV